MNRSELKGELVRLRTAIRDVIDQRGDDLCWRDVYTKLAALVGVEFVPQLMCDPDTMRANCNRFIDSLYNGGPYIPVYVEKAGG